MHCFWILAKLKLTGTYFVQLVHLLLSHPPEKSPQFLSYKNSKYDKCHKLDIVTAGRTNDTSRCRKGRKNVGFFPPRPLSHSVEAQQSFGTDKHARTHAHKLWAKLHSSISVASRMQRAIYSSTWCLK